MGNDEVLFMGLMSLITFLGVGPPLIGEWQRKREAQQREAQRQHLYYLGVLRLYLREIRGEVRIVPRGSEVFRCLPEELPSVIRTLRQHRKEAKIDARSDSTAFRRDREG